MKKKYYYKGIKEMKKVNELIDSIMEYNNAVIKDNFIDYKLKMIKELTKFENIENVE